MDDDDDDDDVDDESIRATAATSSSMIESGASDIESVRRVLGAFRRYGLDAVATANKELMLVCSCKAILHGWTHRIKDMKMVREHVFGKIALRLKDKNAFRIARAERSRGGIPTPWERTNPHSEELPPSFATYLMQKLATDYDVLGQNDTFVELPAQEQLIRINDIAAAYMHMYGRRGRATEHFRG